MLLNLAEAYAINMIKTIKKYISLLMIMGVSLFISNVFVKSVFVGESPRMLPHPEQRLMQGLQNNAAYIARIFNPSLKQKSNSASSESLTALIKKMENVPVQQIAKGTYAKTSEGVTIQIIKLDEITYKEYTYQVNGKEIKIRVPEGQEVPTQDMVEKLQ